MGSISYPPVTYLPPAPPPAPPAGQTLQEAGYSRWHSGEPNNSTPGQLCGAVYRDAGLDDLWCEGLYSFICEKTPGSLLWDDQEDQDL